MVVIAAGGVMVAAASVVEVLVESVARAWVSGIVDGA